MAYAIFIINDIQIGYNKLEASEIINLLVKQKRWIFSKETPNLSKLNKGDKVVIYVAGKGRRYFTASFTIGDSITPYIIDGKTDEEKLLFNMYNLMTPIRDFKQFHRPIHISDIIHHLEFIKHKKNYGLHLRQSIKLISEADFNLIINKTQDIKLHEEVIVNS